MKPVSNQTALFGRVDRQPIHPSGNPSGQAGKGAGNSVPAQLDQTCREVGEHLEAFRQARQDNIATTQGPAA